MSNPYDNFNPDDPVRRCELPGAESQLLHLQGQQVGSYKELANIVQDNPQFIPWAVVIPYTFKQDTEMGHALVFVRAPNASNAATLAILYWEQRILPECKLKWYPVDADYQGKVHITRLDEGDYAGIFHMVWKKSRVDLDKWPMYMTGAPTAHCTMFAAPWFEREEHDFAHLRDAWLDHRKIDPDM